MHCRVKWVCICEDAKEEVEIRMRASASPTNTPEIDVFITFVHTGRIPTASIWESTNLKSSCGNTRSTFRKKICLKTGIELWTDGGWVCISSFPTNTSVALATYIHTGGNTYRFWGFWVVQVQRILEKSAGVCAVPLRLVRPPQGMSWHWNVPFLCVW